MDNLQEVPSGLQYNLFNDYKLVFGLKLQASQLDPFKLKTESPAKRIL